MATRIPLPAGWGEAWLHEPGGHQPKTGCTARSYDHRGRQLVWQPVAAVSDRRVADGRNPGGSRSPNAIGLWQQNAERVRRTRSTFGRFACDVEDGSLTCADMAARFGVTELEFRRRWVVTEVLAKLHDVPILVWLKQRGLSEGDGDGARIVVRESTMTGSIAAFGMLRETGKD